MVVQHILCCRMGKREIKPEPLPEQKSAENKDESSEAKSGDEAEKEAEPKEKDSDATEKEDSEKTEVQDENKNENEAATEDHTEDETAQDDKLPKSDTSVTDVKSQIVEVEEYFVKYRNFSYLHCEWRTEEELYKGDKRIQAKLKRFKQKLQQSINIFENVSWSSLGVLKSG